MRRHKDSEKNTGKMMNMPEPIRDNELPTIDGISKDVLRQTKIPRNIFNSDWMSVDLIGLGNRNFKSLPGSKAMETKPTGIVKTQKKDDSTEEISIQLEEKLNLYDEPSHDIELSLPITEEDTFITENCIEDELKPLSPPTQNMNPLGLNGLQDHRHHFSMIGSSVTEFRITLPLTCEEYKIAQPFTVAEESKRQTGGGEGVEVVKNEEYNDGINKGVYTYKIYHLESRFPWLVRQFMPSGMMKAHEEAWNQFPYCKTIYSNPDYMKKSFFLIVESFHLDDGGQTNHYEPKTEDCLRKHEILYLDIAKSNDISRHNYKAEEDPCLVRSVKTGRGPLTENWQNNCNPIMTVYKVLTYKCQWAPLSTTLEDLMISSVKQITSIFYRRLFCTIDLWHGLTMTDIKRIEVETKMQLEKQINEGKIHGDVL